VFQKHDGKARRHNGTTQRHDPTGGIFVELQVLPMPHKFVMASVRKRQHGDIGRHKRQIGGNAAAFVA
jgi:hypothetical protein